MFERRLKIFLGILLGVMGLLLVRAFHLQVVTRSEWAQAAEDFKKRPVLVETTRGRLLDRKGQPIALDEACMDACVDYRAISRNEKWMRDVAAARVREAQPDEYKKADKEARQRVIDREAEQVRADVDAMFELLAQETREPPEKIDATCRQIELRIAMRSRMRQYRRFLQANAEHESNGDAPWYRRWLIEGGQDGPQVDDFDEVEEEELSVHSVVRNITPEAYLRLARAAPRCPGLVLRPGTHRRYPYGSAGAHAIGALASVTKEDMLADKNLGVDPLREYQFTDFVGRIGLEALCEPTLRGTRGRVYKRIGRDDELDVSPVPGKDVRTTIDIDLQDQIQKMFAEMQVPSERAGDGDTRTFTVPMHGAAVVIDVKSGAVRALASYPDFDVNTLREDYETLATDFDNRPLINRATQAWLEPGSTVKPIVGIAAITQGLNVPPWGVMTPHTGIECTGFLVIRGQKQLRGRCWVASNFFEVLGGAVAHHPIPIPHKGAHGNPDGHLCFADALERSCNIYFEVVADAFGVDGLSYWYDRFGLGHETGVGISEVSGSLPNSLNRYQPSDAWFGGIGQGGVRVTPIQMANVAATIARDGVWMRPRLVEEDVALSPAPTRDNRQIPDRIDLKLSKEAMEAAREGMVRVVNAPAGTGDRGHMAEMIVAGKTGTAQAPPLRDKVINQEGKPALDEKGNFVTELRPLATADRVTNWPWYRGWGPDGTDRNHAWFIGFAPAEDPQVAFAVVVEYGGSGGALAARTSTKILRACIKHGIIKLPR